ncbi:phosphoribosyltransferase family protein [Mogibacterium diversum]|uniref:phosphoribosyltransferase family protein n=1 Tax=Mogibacterium diversum TaxID=114527 RepID=UPI0028EBC8FF|nr:phosphoribosyltransferase family protein [Mogibacterium diversum]
MIRINDKKIDMKHFPDGTMLIKYLADDEITKITWLYDNDEECMGIYFLVKHLRAHGVKVIELFMPYIPNARMDRIKNSDEVFTLKYFAEFINDLKIDSVEVLDPHSNVSTALIDNISIIEPTDIILNLLETVNSDGNTILFFPDEGAMKRYSHIASKCDIPYVFGMKNRDWRSGEILGLEVLGETDAVPGKNIIIIDDICSRGGTFLHSAKALKAMGAADIDLYVSHLEYSVWEGDMIRSGLVRNIYTTNSIYRFQDKGPVKVVKEY